MLQYIFSGLTIGSIYALIALGYTIIYNTTGIINFAQGEFVMLGGMLMIAWVVFRLRLREEFAQEHIEEIKAALEG